MSQQGQIAPSSLTDWLKQPGCCRAELATLVEWIGNACIEISLELARGPLHGAFRASGTQNVQGEDQQALDLASNEIMKAAANSSQQVAAIASEEEDGIVVLEGKENAPYLLLFDPLDGSSNLNVNVSVGTIFSILPASGKHPVEADFLQTGRNQSAAGYAIYGPQTMLVLTIDDGVVGFTLDPASHDWILTNTEFMIPKTTQEFAINVSNRRHWTASIREYIDDCMLGRDGARAKDFNMRWVASMVADVHRIMTRGGVFLYPWDKREPDRSGKLRLMYEANPMSLLVEKAGGNATDVSAHILDVQPTHLHQRVAVVLGSSEEVMRVSSLGS